MKTIFGFLVLVLALSFTACTTHKGYNYAAHSRKNHNLHKKAFRSNHGNLNDMTNWKCTKRH